MKVSVTEIERRQVVLDIEVEPERVQKALDQAFRRAADRVQVPGFRKGKAPRVLVERVVGPDRLREEALERLVPQVYDEAIKERGITPYGGPRVDVVSSEPLLIKATVPLEPRVSLGDYRSIRVERPSGEPTEEEVGDVIQHLRETHAEWAPVERAVQLGDRISVDVKAVVGERSLLDSKDAETIVDLERPQPAPGFAEQLVGMQPGETKSFNLPMPKEDADEDAPEDEQVDFTVTMHGVKERRLPELDDEFARLVGQEYEDYSALKTAIHGQVAESKASGARRELEDNVIGEAVKGSGIEIPPQLVERQADLLLQRLARNLERQGLSVEQYLRFTGRGPEALRAELLSDAETSLSRSLVLDAIADAEQLVVSDEEVDAELALATSDSQSASSMSAAATAAVRERVRAAMRQTKTLRYLLDTAAPVAADALSGTTDQPAAAPATEEEEAHV